ncbi:MAG: T9SS type A sorting domain-containing protein [Prevotellaceae bacterium]|nr:T9SS type A sorting domain-containing protein [Prevotellaceae bacterium]
MTFFKTMLLCAAFVMCAQGAKADVFTAGQKVYFNTNECSGWWIPGANPTAYFVGSTGFNSTWAGVAAVQVQENFYSIVVPGSAGETYDYVIFARTSTLDVTDWDNQIYNRTADVAAQVGNKCYYLESGTTSYKQNGHWGNLIWFDEVSDDVYVSLQFNSSAESNVVTDLSLFYTNYSAGSVTNITLAGGARPNIAPEGLTVTMEYKVIKGSFVVAEVSIPFERPATGDVWEAVSPDNIFTHFTPAVCADDYGVQFWYEINFDGITTYYSNLNNNYKFNFIYPAIFDATSAVGKWVLTSAPFESYTGEIFGFSSSPGVARKTMTSDATNTIVWAQVPASTGFTQGEGFAYSVNSVGIESALNWNHGQKAVTGTLAPDSFDITLQGSGYNKYVLLGNPWLEPFTVGALVDNATNSNFIKEGGYTLTENGTGYNVQTRNYEVKPWTGIILVSRNVDGLLNLDKANMIVDDDDMPHVPALSEQVQITTSNEFGSNYAYLMKSAKGQNIYGNSDLPFANSGVQNYPQPYMSKPTENGENVQLALNTVNSYNATIPIGIFTSYQGTINVALTGMNTYNCNVTLIDNLTGVQTNISGLESYEFETDVNGDADNRFALVLAPQTPTSTTAAETANIQAFVRDGKIAIASTDALQNVTIYSVSGAQVFNATIGGTTYTASATLPAGAYLVKMQTAKETKTQKVVLK